MSIQLLRRLGTPALVIFLTALAAPHPAGAQINPDRVSLERTQQPEWAGELWPADFDRDGITDLTFLTTPASGSDLAVARGRGDGTFESPRAVAAGTGTPIGVGDVNGDGFIDIVTGSHIVPGRGDGTFRSPIAYAATADGVGPAQALDIDLDGRADLVRHGVTGTVVYPGNGDFTFAAPRSLPAGIESQSMIAADLNGDGLPDIASTAAGATRRINLFFNTGNFTFSTTAIPLPLDGGGVTAHDMNGDGVMDLVVGMGAWRWPIADEWTSGQVAVLLGQGGGVFSAPLTFPTLPGPIRVVTGDFNGDGRPDVATGNQTQTSRCESVSFLWASVSVLPGHGDGTLGPAASFAMGDSDEFPDAQYRAIRRLNPSDLNGDGRTDLLFSGQPVAGGAGAVLLLRPPADNRPPVADAGPDIVAPHDSLGGNFLNGATGTDPDHDWLTFEWRDEFGRVFGDTPRTCLEADYSGTQAFTLIVRDGRGGVDGDTRLWTFTTPGPGPLPSGFTGENIGDVGAPGTDSFSGSFLVVGSGADIWGAADEFRFVHTTMRGDFDVVAWVTGVQHVHPWTKGGLMIRERRTPGSRHASVFATPTEVNGVAFQRRPVENGPSVHTPGPARRPPVWLRLVREGDVISAYSRTVETDPWTLIGTQTLPGLSDAVYAGMAVTSHLDGTAAEARFFHFAITPDATAPPAAPIAWRSSDVGHVAATGDVAFDGTTYTVRGSGADIWGAADAFHFAHIRASGDGAMTVRVADLAGPHPWSKAGLMIRQTLAASSVHHYLLASQANGLAYQRRVATGGSSVHTALGGAAPVWFRIERSGGILRLYVSTESGPPSAWQPIADAPFPEGEAFVGLAVTSHADGALATGVFDHASHTFAPTGWTSADVGAVGLAGSDAFDGTAHALTASGADVWGRVDAFRFVYQELPGDGTVVARLTSLAAAHEWTKAGVMIRASPSPSAPHAFMFLSPREAAFQRRRAPDLTTAHTGGGTAGTPLWLRLTRRGSEVTASVSHDGVTWRLVGRDSIEIGAGPVLAGLALTSHDNGALAAATFDHVAVTPGP